MFVEEQIQLMKYSDCFHFSFLMICLDFVNSYLNNQSKKNMQINFLAKIYFLLTLLYRTSQLWAYYPQGKWLVDVQFMSRTKNVFVFLRTCYSLDRIPWKCCKFCQIWGRYCKRDHRCEIFVFSPLVPSKREKNISVLLSLYIFLGKCV